MNSPNFFPGLSFFIKYSPIKKPSNPFSFRNLKDFKVDLQHSVDLKNLLPNDIFSIAESGIYNEEDFKFLKEKGFDGFLMGEYFMKNDNPGNKFGEFVSNVSI